MKPVFSVFERQQNVVNPDTPPVLAYDNHLSWFEAVQDWPLLKDMDPLRQSSILYDLVAIYIAFSDELLQMEDLPITITPDGKSLVEDAGHIVRCATEWHNKEAFLDLVTERLIGGAGD